MALMLPTFPVVISNFLYFISYNGFWSDANRHRTSRVTKYENTALKVTEIHYPPEFSHWIALMLFKFTPVMANLLFFLLSRNQFSLTWIDTAGYDKVNMHLKNSIISSSDRFPQVIDFGTADINASNNLPDLIHLQIFLF